MVGFLSATPLIAACLLSVSAVCCALDADPSPLRSSAAERVPVDFVALTGRGSGADCDASAEPVARCRVRDTADVAKLEAMLGEGRAVAREGDDLVFVWRGHADRVQLLSGLWYPLSPVRGTDLWTLRVRIEHLDRLITTYAFVVDDDYLSQVRERIWRGPLAPTAPEVAEPLRGRMSRHPIRSEHLGSSRDVSIYTPPEVADRPLAAVVYCADGQSLLRFARVIEPLIVAGTLPRVLLAGPHSVADPTQRTREYAPASGKDNSAFPKHERFFIDEVMPFVERTRGVSDTAQRILFGYSNGADWALATAVRHPDRFTGVIALSPGWAMEDALPDSLRAMAFFVGAGSLEGSYMRMARRTASRLDRDGLRHVYREEVAGHDIALWTQLMPEGLRWNLLER